MAPGGIEVGRGGLQTSAVLTVRFVLVYPIYYDVVAEGKYLQLFVVVLPEYMYGDRRREQENYSDTNKILFKVLFTRHVRSVLIVIRTYGVTHVERNAWRRDAAQKMIQCNSIVHVQYRPLHYIVLQRVKPVEP